MTEARDAVEDLIGCFGPDERLRMLVREVDVAADGHLELASAAVHAPPELFLGERGEPPRSTKFIHEPLVGVKCT
jgi:hypothetical protein